VLYFIGTLVAHRDVFCQNNYFIVALNASMDLPAFTLSSTLASIWVLLFYIVPLVSISKSLITFSIATLKSIHETSYWCFKLL